MIGNPRSNFAGTPTASGMQPDFLESVRILEDYLTRYEQVVQAFLPEEGRLERLKTESDALLARYPDPVGRPPLFGILVGVKDIFHIDGFPTAAGSYLPPEDLAGTEAAAVTALKEAGALVAGKTVTTEFAYFAPGPTRNPHNPDHTPGGSSSGSAAAVAAGACQLAFGTQTIGSIIRPASYCGVVGFKPSYDRISRGGVIPLAPSVDHVGLFSADIYRAGQAAAVLCRDWVPDPGLKQKPVLGIPKGPYLQRASPEGIGHFHVTCHRLAQAGYEVKSVEAFADFEAIYGRHNLIVAAEAARVHNKWFAKYGDRYHPKTVDLIRRGQKIPDTALSRDLIGRVLLRDELAALMEQHGIDLWISPSATGPAPRGLESTGDPVMNLPWTYAGLPTLNLPAGINPEGLPLGLQVTARWYQDEALLTWGGDLERALGGADELN